MPPNMPPVEANCIEMLVRNSSDCMPDELGICPLMSALGCV